MTTTFPSAVDSLPRPASTTLRNAAGYELHTVVDNLSDAIEAVETKLGTGAATAAPSGGVLRATGAGASAWGPAQSADLAAGIIGNSHVQDGVLTAAKFAPGNVMQLIQSTGILGASSGLVSFTPIAATWRGLELRIVGRSTAAVVSEAVLLKPNGDGTAGNYFGQQTLVGAAATASAAELAGLAYAHVGLVPGASSSNAGWHGAITVTIQNYTGGQFKTIAAVNYLNTNTSAGAATVRVQGSSWALAAAITRLDVGPISGQWAAGSIISLYGIP